MPPVEPSVSLPGDVAVVDVAVIGAGVAGLNAAGLLLADGYSVAVLEGRDRTGGRLLSVAAASPEHGLGLDLGATWFWSNEPLIQQIVADEGLAVFAQHLDGDTMVQGPDNVRRFEGNQIDAPSGRLVGGMQSVTDALAQRLPDDCVHLNQVVHSVSAETSDDRLWVHTASDSWIARQVIVAAPPAAALHTIDFGDLIDDQVRELAAATPVWMGATTKVVAEYQHAFWREAGLAGAGFSHVGPLREIHDMSGPDGSPAALFGFAQMGADAAPTRDEVTAQLSALFGPEAASPTAVHVLDWRDDPMTSPPDVTRLTTYEIFGHPLLQNPTGAGRVHWASTETATVAPGHIEGALSASGRAAAEAIHRLGTADQAKSDQS